jgi:hypothetical protein
MLIHGSQMRIGKVIRDRLWRIIYIELMKGTVHAHPAIVRPQKENSIAVAKKVETTTIQTIKGILDFTIPETLNNSIFISLF